MSLVGSDAQAARGFFKSEIASRFPQTFRALQDMVVAASKAYKNQGKKSWFGRDKGADSYVQFMASVNKLATCFSSEQVYLVFPSEMERLDALNTMVLAFFAAYPNWQDAMIVWEGSFEGVKKS